MSRSPQERHQPQKRWGQNFLRNPGAVKRIVEAAAPAPGDLVLEIGPGEGVLTQPLLETGARLRLIEIDPSLADRLTRRFGDAVELFVGDAIKADLPAEPFIAVGNLPYNAATPIIRRVLEDNLLRRAVFMVQKEVADRITAQPGDESYGYLSLVVRLTAAPRQILTLAPGSFHPQPKVRSTVVLFEPGGEPVTSPNQAILDLVSQSFRMRRKKLVNNLEGFRGLERWGILSALEQAELSRDVRAEEMSLPMFDRLAGVIGRLSLSSEPLPP